MKKMDIKNGLKKLGYVANLEKHIDYLTKLLPDNQMVSVEDIDNFIESSEFKKEYIDPYGNSCEEHMASMFRFATPFTSKEGCLIYGYFSKREDETWIGVRWTTIENETRKYLKEVGYIDKESWKQLCDLIKKTQLLPFGNYIKLPVEYLNGAGYPQFENGTKVDKQSGKFALLHTDLHDSDGAEIVGWFTKAKEKGKGKEKYSGIDWGTMEDFSRAQDIRKSFEWGKFLFKDISECNRFITEIANKAIPEPWDFSEKKQSKKHPILASYIRYELDRLLFEDAQSATEEKKILYNEQHTALYYNTNLLTRYGRDLCILGFLEKGRIVRYTLTPSNEELMRAGFKHVTIIPKCPSFLKILMKLFIIRTGILV